MGAVSSVTKRSAAGWIKTDKAAYATIKRRQNTS
jgi:hypothetical protein